MATALPYQNKIKFPLAASFQEDVIRLNFGGGYSQRVRKGYNAQTGTVTLTWTELTEAEMRDIAQQIKAAGGTDLFIWRSPMSTTDQKWSIAEHMGQQLAAGYWEYQATLTLEYDP